jgi:hypothetical protein
MDNLKTPGGGSMPCISVKQPVLQKPCSMPRLLIRRFIYMPPVI